MGAVFTNYSGEIENEIPFLTGAYICPNLGTLKVIDINANANAKDYPPILSIFTAGEYHIYDYMFFYCNLQSNVSKRVNRYLSNFK